MKIGILTFHYAYNFGALLQAYALQQFLTGKGHEVEVIDYRNPAIVNSYDYDSWQKFRHARWGERISLIRFWLNMSGYWHRRKRHFRQFVRQHLRLSATRHDAGSLATSTYDAFVIGSDQVWNIRLTDGFDPCYWGNFNTPHPHTKMAYAVSCGRPEFFSPAEKETLRRYLANFERVSVREDTLRTFLHGLLPSPPRLVLDPTLLVDRAAFRQITGKRVFPFPYVLVYAVEQHPALLDIAKACARKLHARVVHVEMKTCKTTLRPPHGIRLYDPTFPELLSLFQYAECAVTLSFHGVALSLIYEKDFYALRGSSMDRVLSLLGQLGLTERVLDGDSVPHLPAIDYVAVNRKLEAMRRDSAAFLQEALTVPRTAPQAANARPDANP